MIRTLEAVAALSGPYHRAAWLDRRAPRSDDFLGSGGPVSGLVGGGRGGDLAGVAVERRWAAPEAILQPADELASKTLCPIATVRTSGHRSLCRPPQNRVSFRQLLECDPRFQIQKSHLN